MKNIVQNWKTSLLGGGVLTSALIYWANNPGDYKTALIMAATGVLGLLASDGKSTTPPEWPQGAHS